MRILSHRGLWRKPAERNSIAAFARSLEWGFGLETDVRDCAGRLVISHDMPVGDELSFDDLLRMLHRTGLPLALNIKADGLASCIKDSIGTQEGLDWFAFDMSVPDMRTYLAQNLPVFARVSDIEVHPPWAESVAGIWFDSLEGNNYDLERIEEFLRRGLRVCVVSPELHNRSYKMVWKDLASLSEHTDLMLCTDHPEQARQFFEKW